MKIKICVKLFPVSNYVVVKIHFRNFVIAEESTFMFTCILMAEEASTSICSCVCQGVSYIKRTVQPLHWRWTELPTGPHRCCGLVCCASGLAACCIFITSLFASAMALEGTDDNKLPCGVGKVPA